MSRKWSLVVGQNLNEILAAIFEPFSKNKFLFDVGMYNKGNQRFSWKLREIWKLRCRGQGSDPSSRILTWQLPSGILSSFPDGPKSNQTKSSSQLKSP